MQYPEPHLSRTTDGEALVSIASRNNLPPRVRMLLEGMLSLSGGVLERVLSNTLNEFEQQLFKEAERARNASEQHEVFSALREVKRGRADVAPRFMQHLESSLASLDEPRPPRGLQVTSQRRGGAELTLVDSHDLEEKMSLQEVAAKGEIRHTQALYALGHRFGVLAGTPLFDAESLPLGPHHLCDSLRYTIASLGLKLEHRQIVYKLFDRQVTPELGVLYAALNDYLVEKRVLRFLNVILRKMKPGGSPETHPAAAGTQHPETAAAVIPRSETSARESSGSSYAMGVAPRLTPRDALAPSAEQRAAEAQAATNDAELFTTLRELLGGRRSAMPSSVPAAPTSNYTATGDDLQSVLGALQTRPAAPMMLGGRMVQRSVGHVKQDLLAQLRQFTPDGRAAKLQEEDGDTIDLVGMLFDHISKDARPNGATQSLLTKLQVPVLRVALRDKSFFTRRAHPARQLLNAMAETGAHWVDDGDGETDRALVEKMQLVVDRATHEYDGRIELFEELLGDLSRHMGTLARKAEVAERRHVDAAKGRERLDVARENAAAAINDRLGRGKPSRLVRALMEQAWTDVLALTILRQGENSDTYRRRLGIADKLIAGEDDPSLREEMEQGLSQVGFLPEEIQTMVRQIVAPAGMPVNENAASRTEMAMRLKSKTRLGEEGADTAHAKGRQPLQPPLSDEEIATLERLKTLPFGTWFDFVTNQQGDRVRRKLSWFSTLTGRCLFVNQRGARADERTLEQLARDVTRGQIRVAGAEHESVIDRAWNAIKNTLRQFSGSPAPQGA